MMKFGGSCFETRLHHVGHVDLYHNDIFLGPRYLLGGIFAQSAFVPEKPSCGRFVAFQAMQRDRQIVISVALLSTKDYEELAI